MRCCGPQCPVDFQQACAFPWGRIQALECQHIAEVRWEPPGLMVVTSTSYWVSVVFSGINVVSDSQVLRKTCSVHLFLL